MGLLSVRAIESRLAACAQSSCGSWPSATDHTQHIRMSVRPADRAAIEEAGRLLREGALVAFPTETVYGLGADATNGRAVAGIFDAKGRPSFNPLIVHVPDLASAERIAVMAPLARKLAEAFWPGPLTLVMKRRAEAGISDLVSAGLDTLAVR